MVQCCRKSKLERKIWLMADYTYLSSVGRRGQPGSRSWSTGNQQGGRARNVGVYLYNRVKAHWQVSHDDSHTYPR